MRPRPLDDGERAFVLETLRQEAMELFSQQRAIADKGARALALGATVLAGFAAYGVAGKASGHELLLRALPAALALIGIELVTNFIAEGAMARTRMAIEDALANHLGVTVLAYDRYVRLRKGVTVLGAIVGGVFILLYGGVVYLTQGQEAHTSGIDIDTVHTIVSVARIATVITGVALLSVIIILVLEERRSRAPITIVISRQRADAPA